MKKNVIVGLLLIVSCSHAPDIKTTPFPPVLKTEVKNEKINDVKELPRNDLKNIDLNFQSKMKDLWPQYIRENFNESRSLDIFVATNRKKISEAPFGCSDAHYSINLTEANHYDFGVCKISVPRDHSTGNIEFSFDPKASTQKFYKPVNAKIMSEDTFFEGLKKSKRIPLIFIHGFNVRYHESLLRASQIAYDLKYQGPVILFSWPSGGDSGILDDTLLNKVYEKNKISADKSTLYFQHFLEHFLINHITVNIMVHSMGHVVTLPAINELANHFENSEESTFINELILNAPDFDAQTFQALVPGIKKLAKRITLYCSPEDKALKLSMSMNKSGPRLGSCVTSPESVDTINVSLVDNDTFSTGHSYYTSRAILTDVFQVLLGMESEKRLFMKKSDKKSTEKFLLRN